MNAHLVQCGSKTTKCSKCLKYIRRSIYAYHLDNNCIDFNEYDATDNDHLISEKINFQIDDKILIPCEMCDEQILFSSYDSHLVIDTNPNQLFIVYLFLENLFSKSKSSSTTLYHVKFLFTYRRHSIYSCLDLIRPPIVVHMLR
jgi:hypothetical protein